MVSASIRSVRVHGAGVRTKPTPNLEKRALHAKTVRVPSGPKNKAVGGLLETGSRSEKNAQSPTKIATASRVHRAKPVVNRNLEHRKTQGNRPGLVPRGRKMVPNARGAVVVSKNARVAAAKRKVRSNDSSFF
jgi:hypothetical protein